MEEKKKSWGGKRKGAGRPKGSSTGINHPYKKVMVAFEESDYIEMKGLADKSGKSFSRFIADKVLGR